MSLFGGGRRGPRERTEEERRQALIERERRRTGNPHWQPPAGHPLSTAPSTGPSTPAAAASSTTTDATATRRPSAAAEPVLRPARPAGAQTPRSDTRIPPAPASLSADDWWDDGELHTGDPQPPVAAWPPPAVPGQPAAQPTAKPRSADPAPRAARPRSGTPKNGAAPAAGAAAASAGASQQPAPTVRIEPEPPAQPVAPAYDLPDHRQVAVHRRRSIAGRATTRTVVSPPGDANMGGTLAPPSRRRRWITLVIVLVLGALAWTQWKLWQPLSSSGTTEVLVKIPEGAGASEVGQRLQAAGVVDSARLFTLRAAIAGKREDLPSGTVTLKKDMSYGAALAELSGNTVAVPDLRNVTIPEGLSIREIAARFKRQDIVDDYGTTAVKVLRDRHAELRSAYGVPKAARTLEGLLFPSTYQLPVGFTARDLIDRQLQAFQQNISGVSMTKAKKANLSPYDVVTIASMVEREARLTRERPLIAAVIYNRLKAGMPLGIDATFRYASGDWINPITQSQLLKDGPFNSRTRTGLPPSPIGNPGLASIEAAAKPAKVPYLYFVVKPGRCGEHAFSATAEKFAQDTAKYNAARDAAGKSPVTC